MKKALRISVASVAAGCASIISGTAGATTLDFYFLAGGQGSQVEAHWTQSSTPTPFFYTAGQSTYVPAKGYSISTFSDGEVDYDSFSDVTFFNDSQGGGFYAGTLNGSAAEYDQYGSLQMYSGPESAPVFSPGDFYYFFYGQLIVTAEPAAVPEPGSWAMMLTGLGVIGVALGRRRSSQAH